MNSDTCRSVFHVETEIVAEFEVFFTYRKPVFATFFNRPFETVENYPISWANRWHPAFWFSRLEPTGVTYRAPSMTRMSSGLVTMRACDDSSVIFSHPSPFHRSGNAFDQTHPGLHWCFPVSMCFQPENVQSVGHRTIGSPHTWQNGIRFTVSPAWERL